MQNASAINVLTRHKLRRDGDKFYAEPKTVVSVYLANGTQTLILDRIVSVEIHGDVAMIETARHELYGVELADLRAVRVTPESSGPGYR